MSLDVSRTLSAMGDSLAYAYGAFTGVKESQAENTPPVGSRDQVAPQVGNSGARAGFFGLGMLPLLAIAAGLFFMLKK